VSNEAGEIPPFFINKSMYTWQSLPLPTPSAILVSGATLVNSADNTHLILVSGGSGSGDDLLIQFYNVAANTWGSQLTVPASTAGGTINPNSFSQVVNNKVLFLTPSAGVLVQLDIITNAITTYPYPVQSTQSTTFNTDTQYVYTQFETYWFPSYPTAFFIGYSSPLDHVLEPLIAFDIETVAVLGVVLRQATQAHYGSNSGSFDNTNYTVPAGFVWGLDSSLNASGYIGDPTTIITSGDFTGSLTFDFVYLDFTTNMVVPYQTLTVVDATLSGNGDITPTTPLTTYETNIFTLCQLAYSTGIGVTATITNITGSGYDVSVNLYNNSAQTIGTAFGTTVPTNFYPGTGSLIQPVVASTGTAYIISSVEFYKLIYVPDTATITSIMIVS
jgi:hypothetical protein